MPVRNWNQWIVETSGYKVGPNGTMTDKTSRTLIGTYFVLFDLHMLTDGP